MTAEARAAHRTGRSYTRARRMPWVVGKIQGVTLPFGPYTATQLGILLGGAWLLVQTFRFWSHLGPAGLIFLAVPPVAAWAVRHAKVEGRSPARAVAGYLALLAEPGCGRIGGRVARDARPVSLRGRIRISAAAPVRPVRPVRPVPDQSDADAGRPGPVPTALQQFLASGR